MNIGGNVNYTALGGTTQYFNIGPTTFSTNDPFYTILLGFWGNADSYSNTDTININVSGYINHTAIYPTGAFTYFNSGFPLW